MPPLEAKKMLFIMTVARGAFEKCGTKDEQKLTFIDVRKAHFNVLVDDQEWVFVELPPQFSTPTAVLRGLGSGYMA